MLNIIASDIGGLVLVITTNWTNIGVLRWILLQMQTVEVVTLLAGSITNNQIARLTTNAANIILKHSNDCK